MEDKISEKETTEDVVIIDGVEYVRKNKKQILEEPVIEEKDGRELLTE